MKKYELLLVLPGTLDEKEAGKQVQEIKDLVNANSQDIELNNLGKVRLAYPIKQIRYGYYYTLVFNAEPAAVKIISDKLKLRADVLRSMISHFNTNVTAAKKITYNTNEVGVTTMLEKESDRKEEKVRNEAVPASTVRIDLKAIDEKLNEILDNDIIPGV
jgi:small subunit ribosomal protein S6